METLEQENSSLKGVLPKDYSKPSLAQRLLGELIDLISTIGLGTEASRSQDIQQFSFWEKSRVYYFVIKVIKKGNNFGDDGRCVWR